MDSLKKNYIYNVIYQLLTIIIPIVTTPYLSRVLGPDGIGEYTFYNSISNYFVIFILLGLNNYGNREIAKHRDNKGELSTTFCNIYAMQLFLGVVVLISYFFFVFCYSKNTYISLIFSLYVISAIFDINWFYFGLERFKLTVTRNIIIKILSTILIFIFVKNSNDVAIYCLIMTGSLLLSQIVLWPFVFGTIDFVKPKWAIVKTHIKPNMFLFLTVLAVSLFKVMDKIMLGIISSKGQVGFYESAEKIIAIPIALIVSLGAVMLPRISNMISKELEYRMLINKSMIFAMFVSSALCFGIMSVSKEFVPIFYGEGFEICIYLYLILLPSCIFLAFANVIRTQFLLPNQMDRPYIISAFMGAIVNIVLNFILIPKYQSVGAAIGTLGAELIVCIYQSYVSRKYLPLKEYVVNSLPFVLSGVIMFLILYPLSFDNIYISLVVKILLGIIIYILLAVILMRIINNKELQFFAQLLKSFKSKA